MPMPSGGTSGVSVPCATNTPSQTRFDRPPYVKFNFFHEHATHSPSQLLVAVAGGLIMRSIFSFIQKRRHASSSASTRHWVYFRL